MNAPINNAPVLINNTDNVNIITNATSEAQNNEAINTTNDLRINNKNLTIDEINLYPECLGSLIIIFSLSGYEKNFLFIFSSLTLVSSVIVSSITSSFFSLTIT